jgi:hypothetical protein
VRRAALLAAGLALLAGCSTGGDEVAPDRSEATLEQQREDVRAATAQLQRAAAQELGGTVTSSSGEFRGCQAGGLEEYRNFRYLAQARIDVPPATARPYLPPLRSVLEAAGFGDVEEASRPGGSTLGGVKGEGDLAATFSELPDQGDYVLLSVAGPCVDVPEEDRDDWLTREEQSPDIR